MAFQSKIGAIVATIALFSGQCAASAATVYPEKGGVLVNDGHGFMLIDGETPVYPGSKVMAQPNGAAVINYGDGCAVHVNPGEVKVVQSPAPCSTGGVQGPGATTMLIVGGAAAAAVGVGVAMNQGKPASP